MSIYSTFFNKDINSMESKILKREKVLLLTFKT